jgi:sulfide dehydrogenase cytochrome subunit
MDRKVTQSVFILFVVLMFNPMAWAIGDAPPLLVGTCVGCHGHDGSSMGPAAPTIAGLDTQTFIHIMKSYRRDGRPSTIMGRLARGYTNNEIEIMADYFGKKTFVRQVQKVDRAKVMRGRELHKEYCEKCHEQDGSHDVDRGGILAGQWMPFIKFNLIDFRMGARDLPKDMSRRLRMMVRRNGESSIDDIIHFYGSQNY